MKNLTDDRQELIMGGERVTVSREVLEKYNQPGPRYTSYLDGA
jgi:hypothetical protein